MRIVRMILLVVLTAHYIACGWHLVTGDDPNAPNAVPPGSSVWDQYVSDLYYAVLLIQGQGISSGGTTSQNLFSVVAVLVGSIVLAIVAMLVANFNANSTSHQRKMEAVFATMNKLRLPQDLRDRIHQYYEYVWHEYESLDGDVVKFSKELTHTLALEVGLYRHMDLVMNVPFWRGCSPDFVKQLVLSLSVRVYLPDDYVVRAGEVGTEMYLVNRGTCEFGNAVFAAHDELPKMRRKSSECDANVCFSEVPTAATTSRSISQPNSRVSTYHYPEDDSGRRIRRLKRKPSRRSSISTSCGESTVRSDLLTTTDDEGTKEQTTTGQMPVYPMNSSSKLARRKQQPRRIKQGQSFGEMALLLNYRRTATVRAVSYVEMCTLSRDHFQSILSRYPDDRRTVLHAMLTQCVDKGELPLRSEDICELVVAKRGVVVSDTDEDCVESISKNEIVGVLLDLIDRPTRDISIKFGIQECETRPSSISDLDELPLRRRSSSGSQSGIPLEKVREVDIAPSSRPDEGSVGEISTNATELDTTNAARCAEDIDATVSRKTPAVSLERWSKLEKDVNGLNSRIQTVGANQTRMIAMLLGIKTHLAKLNERCIDSSTSARIPPKPSHSMETTQAHGDSTTPDEYPISRPEIVHQRLNRRNSGPPHKEANTRSLPASSANPCATRLVDALWVAQTAASGTSATTTFNTPTRTRLHRRRSTACQSNS